MDQKPKKLLVLGLDAAMPDLLQKFVKEGHLPNIAKIMEKGVFSRVTTTFPPLTAAAWASIVTGAGPGTAGIPSLMVKMPGQDLDSWHTSFDRNLQLAETLWESGNRVGKKTVLVNWPVTWPMGGLENGVQVAGSLNPPFRFFYMPLWDTASSSVFSTKLERCNQVPGRAVVVKPEVAEGWTNVPYSKSTPLEISITIPPTYVKKGIDYQALIIDTQGKGYDQIIISKSKDIAQAVVQLGVGEFSNWLTESILTEEGEKLGRFRFHLVELSPDGENLRLYASAINTAENYTQPEDLTARLEEVAGPYMEVDDPWAYMDGWITLDHYLEQLQAHADWWGKATKYTLENYEWDLAFSWVGTIDHVQHVLYGGIVPECRVYDADKAEMCWDSIRHTYQQVDDNIARILEAVDLNNTMVVLVSDHGFTHLDWNPFIKHFLAEAGLLSFDFHPETGQLVIDWSKTKCHPLEPGHAHIFINLKGRDPQGIVESEDYAKVQQEIISALRAIRDPETGESIVSVAITKEEAVTLGVYEGPGFERVGDVLFALKPGYMANPFIYKTAIKYADGTERIIPNPEGHEPAVLGQNFTGAHLTLPGIKEMEAAFVLSGPSVPHLEMPRPIRVIDIAPTIAHLLGIPIPKDAEGGILSDITEKGD